MNGLAKVLEVQNGACSCPKGKCFVHLWYGDTHTTFIGPSDLAAGDKVVVIGDHRKYIVVEGRYEEFSLKRLFKPRS